MLLEGKVAFITGAAHGIGQAIARRYVEEGAKVILADIDVDGGNGAAQELANQGYPAVFCPVDVTDEGSLEKALEATLSAFDRLNIVVVNAGVNYDALVVDTPVEDWKRLMDVNLTGAFLTAKVFARYLIDQAEGGRIIFASSEAGKHGEAGASAYCASKFAVIGLLESLALELATHNITVNGVCPGMIDSKMLRWVAEAQAKAQDKTFDEMWQEFIDLVPMGRLGGLEEAADAYVFLASDLATYVTGETVNVDGGLLPG